MFWIKDKEAFVATEEFGQDLEHVEVLQRKFEEFQKDMASQVNKDIFFRFKISQRIPHEFLKEFPQNSQNSQRIPRQFDLEHVEILQLKFEEFQKDIASQVNILFMTYLHQTTNFVFPNFPTIFFSI